MKKFTLILLSLLVLLSGCGKEEAPAPTNAPQADMIVTNPEETSGEINEATMDPEDITEPVETETVTRLVRTSILDEKGNEILYREYSYDEYGRQTESWEYSDGELTAFSSTDYVSDTEYVTSFDGYTVSYVCDENGNLLSQQTEQDGIVTNIHSYTYDEYGNKLTADMSYEHTQVSIRYEYTYDDSGKILTSHEYQAEKLTGWTELQYNEAGLQVEARYYGSDGTLTRSTVTTRDGNTQTHVSRDADGNAYLTQIITVDDLGNTLSQETWQDDVMVSRTEYTYESFEIIAQ